MFRDIVFMQDSEGREVVDRLTRTEGVVVRGATDATIAEAIEYLAQWDMDDDGEIRHEIPAGTRDEMVERDGYVLTWNVGLGYVGLCRRIDVHTDGDCPKCESTRYAWNGYGRAVCADCGHVAPKSYTAPN